MCYTSEKFHAEIVCNGNRSRIIFLQNPLSHPIRISQLNRRNVICRLFFLSFHFFKLKWGNSIRMYRPHWPPSTLFPYTTLTNYVITNASFGWNIWLDENRNNFSEPTPGYYYRSLVRLINNYQLTVICTQISD